MIVIIIIIIIIIKMIMINIIRKHGEVKRHDNDRLKGDKDPSNSSVACFLVFLFIYLFIFGSKYTKFVIKDNHSLFP